METEFATAPSRDRPFVFFGSSHAVLKIAACCSAVMRGGRPLRLRSDSSSAISASSTCRSSLHSISIKRSQLSRTSVANGRRHHDASRLTSRSSHCCGHPWHCLLSLETGERKQLPHFLCFKQCQFVPAALGSCVANAYTVA